MSAEWTITRGIPEELPSVVAIYDVIASAPDSVKTSFRVASAKDRRSRSKILDQLRSTLKVGPAVEGDNLFGGMRVIVYSDGSAQTDLGATDTDPALQRGLTVRDLTRLGMDRLPVQADIDASISKHPMSHDH